MCETLRALPTRSSAKLTIREHELYTGLKQDRVKHKSDAGTDVNTCYYGPGNLIEEFMGAATELFGKGCLLQFEVGVTGFRASQASQA